jgi:carboxypeptidase family protein
MRLSLHAFAVTLAFAVCPPLVAAQVGSSTDIITGRVTGPDGQPLSGARVEATSLETDVTRTRSTDQNGRYTILFPDGGGQYRVTVRYLGMQPVTLALAREADEDRFVTDVRMGAVATQLAPVVVRERAGTPPRGNRPEAGSTERVLTGEQLARLPIDPSDPNALAQLAPGVVGLSATDTTPGGFSVAGQRPDQNQITLDGLTFGAEGIPQEAIRTTRVITSTYDVARGQFTGGQVATTTRSGTNVLQGSFNYSLRDPRLGWQPADETGAFNQSLRQHQLSGGLGGALRRNKSFVFGSVQVRRRTQDLQSLLAAGGPTLVRLGISPDSAQRFQSIVDQYGVPVASAGVEGERLPDDRTADNLSTLARSDFTLNESHSLMVRGDWRYSTTGAFRVGPLAVPTHGGEQRSGGAGGMVQLSSTLGSFLNEARAYYSRNTTSSEAYLRLPEGRVRVTSALEGGGRGISVLEFGGNPALPQESTNDQIELADELSWLPGTARHRIKLGTLLNITNYAQSSGGNQFGSFTYNSLEDFEANQPAQLTRSLTSRDRRSGAANAALYVGDSWQRRGGFQLTYGLRAEGTRYLGEPEFNPDVERLFGRRTDEFPTELRVSPRVGFTWTIRRPQQPRAADQAEEGQAPADTPGERGGRGAGRGRGGRGGGLGASGAAAGASTILRGGFGEFRGRAPTSLFADAADAAGLASSELQLVCVGSSVPAPDWSAYLGDPSTIPTQCADGGGVSQQTRLPVVTVFDPGFRAPRSWRTSLGVQQRLFGRFGINVEGAYSVGAGLYGVRDLNLDTIPAFTIEGGRPIFVEPALIVPATGAVSVLDSRVHSDYAQVFDVQSRLRSRTAQVTIGINGVTPPGLVMNLSYTWQRTRDQGSYSAGRGGGGSAQGAFASNLTASNPNLFEWATSDLDRRHSIVGTLTALPRPWFDVTAIVRASSGAPFTPRIGSDVNGDGARNDRAFIFDPRDASLSGDTALVNGMTRLLASTPSAVRECLESQLNRVAARNSCSSGWSGSFDIQANFRPSLGRGLGRRLMVSVNTSNLLAGLDRLFHGESRLRGWGQSVRPDPTLLYVRGFNAAAERFIYEVNERFGDTRGTRTAFRAPFQIGIQARWTVGPDRQREALQGLLRGGRGATGPGGGGRAGGRGPLDARAAIERVAPNPAAAVLELRDSLALTADQVERLTRLRDSLAARNDSLVAVATEQAAGAGGAGNPAATFAAIRPTLEAAREGYLSTIDAMLGILTQEQWAKLPESLRSPQERVPRRELRRRRERPPGL